MNEEKRNEERIEEREESSVEESSEEEKVSEFLGYMEYLIINTLAAYALTSAHPSFFNEHLLYPVVPYCTQIHSLGNMK